MPYGTQDVWSDVKTLPTTGTYRLRVDPVGRATGTTTAELDPVPADRTGTLTAGGAAEALSSAAGQNGAFTSTGTAAEHVTLTSTSSTVSGCSCVTLSTPSGSCTYYGTVPYGSGSVTSGSLTLPATYRITVDPVTRTAGTMRLTLDAG